MLCYLNGDWIDYAAARIAPWDYGFAMGVCVTEQLRTFNQQLFCPQWHLERLFDGLAIVGVDCGLSADQLAELAQQAVDKNLHQLGEGHDAGVGIAVTPGLLSTFAPTGSTDGNQPTVLIYCYPLQFHSWAEQYRTGLALAIVDTRELPAECVPRALKCRSRMHYYLAEHQAQQQNPGSRALLLDADGHIAEATTATIVIIERKTIVVPPIAAILPGTALRYLLQLANESNISVVREPIDPDRMKAADEVFWLSTPVAMLPVVRVDQQAIGSGKPGPMYDKLLSAWTQHVGVDIAAQAQKFARPGPLR